MCFHYLLFSNTSNTIEIYSQGSTALIIAADAGHEQCVKLLLTHSADVNLLMQNDVSALWVAAQNGHLNVCRLLVTHNAAVNQRKSNGATPLFVAAEFGHLPSVKFLIEEGHADPHIGLFDVGGNPLYAACQAGHREVTTNLEKVPLTLILTYTGG